MVRLPEFWVSRRVYRLRPERFRDLQGWLEQVEGFWSEQLESFKAVADSRRAGRKGRRS